MTVMSPVYTPADLLNPPDEKLYELLDGELVEKSVSMLSLWIATQIAHLIKLFVDPRSLGYVVIEQPVVCFEDRPNRGRRPDVCYVSKQRWPGPLTDGNLEVAPELVVEVVSTHDNAADLQAKVHEYLDAGVLLVWTVYPAQRVVRIHHPGGSERVLGTADTLSGEAILPGFTCPVADIFPKI